MDYRFKPTLLLFFGACLVIACKEKVSSEEKKELGQQSADTVQTAIGELILPSPYSSEPTTNRSKVIGWSEGQTPKVPEGFTVTKFASDLDNPRATYVGPNKDLFVV